MGTAAIAAQAMTNILENVNGIFGIGVGMCLMTVVGQCMGAGRKEEAKYYIVKLAGIAEVGIIVSCLLVLALVKPITMLGGMEPESAKMCIEMVGAIINSKTSRMGTFVCSGIRNESGRRREVFNDNVDYHYVGLPCCIVYCSCKDF